MVVMVVVVVAAAVTGWGEEGAPALRRRGQRVWARASRWAPWKYSNNRVDASSKCSESHGVSSSISVRVHMLRGCRVCSARVYASAV